MRSGHPDSREVSRSLCRHLAYGFDVDHDVDAIADHHATRLEHLVPGEPELPAVDRGRGAERGAFVAPGILRLTEDLDVEHDVARDALDGQRAVDAQMIGGRRCDARGLEGDFRIALDVEEI